MDRATRDCVISDLSRKIGEDTSAAVLRVVRLIPEADAGMFIAISAAGSALGLAAGFTQIMHRENSGVDPSAEECVDALWSMLRPMVLKAAGGSDADFKALLAEVGASDARRKAALMGGWGRG